MAAEAVLLLSIKSVGKPIEAMKRSWHATDNSIFIPDRQL